MTTCGRSFWTSVPGWKFQIHVALRLWLWQAHLKDVVPLNRLDVSDIGDKRFKVLSGMWWLADFNWRSIISDVTNSWTQHEFKPQVLPLTLNYNAMINLCFPMFANAPETEWHSLQSYFSWFKTPGFKKKQLEIVITVDGSEIRRLPVEVGSLSQYLQGFSTIPGG